MAFLIHFSFLYLEVNYETERMLSPHEGRIQRQFQKGLWLQIRTSAHQRQIHAKINRIQIDNQVVNCLFPVILAPVPPPKSVLADSIPKPFIGNVKKLHILYLFSCLFTFLNNFKLVYTFRIMFSYLFTFLNTPQLFFFFTFLLFCLLTLIIS